MEDRNATCLSKLKMTCRKRVGSPKMVAGTDGAKLHRSSRPCACAWFATTSMAASTHWLSHRNSGERRSAFTCAPEVESLHFELHVSALDLGDVENVVDQRKQRFAAGANLVHQLLLQAQPAHEIRARRWQQTCSPSSFESSSKPVEPITPFSGVRIS